MSRPRADPATSLPFWLTPVAVCAFILVCDARTTFILSMIPVAVARTPAVPVTGDVSLCGSCRYRCPSRVSFATDRTKRSTLLLVRSITDAPFLYWPDSADHYFDNRVGFCARISAGWAPLVGRYSIRVTPNVPAHQGSSDLHLRNLSPDRELGPSGPCQHEASGECGRRRNGMADEPEASR